METMYIDGIGTAVPPARYTKADCWTAFRQSEWFGRLDARALLVARTVLTRDNGIDARRLVVDSLVDAFTIDPDTLHRRFVAHAPRLAIEAAANALADAGLAADAIDAVVVSTCTGYLCPGLSGYVVEGLGLRPDTLAFDVVGQGCGAALPNMRVGAGMLASGCEHVLSICVEVSSAAMYLDNDPGVLISACLFGDGAGAAVLSATPAAGRRRIAWKDFASSIDPSERDALRFEQSGGMLRNVLTRRVPTLAADAAHEVLERVLARADLPMSAIDGWVMHAGGRDVLAAVERRFDLDPHHLRYSAAMLREYGNLSSAFVYFVIEAALADDAPGGLWWLSSFGAGFTCHGALLEVA